MKVGFNSYHITNNYSCLQNSQDIQTQPSFGSAKARKLIVLVQNANNHTLKKLKVTFDNMVAVYEELGYDVILKRGSHAIIPLTDTINLPLIIPHGGQKHIPYYDLKRLQYILNGDIQKALNVH